MLNKMSKMRFLTCVAGSVFSAQIATAATIEWQFDTPGITVNSTSLVQTVDEITVTASGYVAELGFELDNPSGFSDAQVVGPFPTSSADAALPPFGINIRGPFASGTGEQLGLNVDPEPGAMSTGSDTGGGGVNPGFDSGPYANLGSFGNRFEKFDFALFEFSAPVDIGSVVVDDVTNNARDAWFAFGTAAPDFSSGFLASISDYTVVNGDDDASDGLFEHALNASNLSFLLVGAPPRDGLGPLNSGNSQFFIDSFANVSLSETVAPPVSAVPLPAGLPLVLSGLLGFGLLRRRKKSA